MPGTVTQTKNYAAQMLTVLRLRMSALANPRLTRVLNWLQTCPRRQLKPRFKASVLDVPAECLRMLEICEPKMETPKLPRESSVWRKSLTLPQ